MTSLIGNWPGQLPLTTATGTPDPNEAELDLETWVGQRTATYRFDLVDGVTGEQLGELHPIRSGATISHDTTRTVKRELRVNLGVADTAAINPLTDRVAPSMLLGAGAYPLGRFMFTNQADAINTGGDRAALVLLDEMFLVDQQLSSAWSSTAAIQDAILDLLAGLPLPATIVEASPYAASGAWAPGTTRGQVLAAYATQGDYMTPWLDNRAALRMIRTVDPDTAVATIDLDRGRRVIQDSISETSDLLTAPNRFVVTSNSGDALAGPITGSYDVPPSAPYSIAQRGFVIPQVVNLQVANSSQATAAARNLGIRQSVFRRTTLATAPDPRHDSYDVVRWRGVNWLELAWSMTLQEGAPMSHALRRSFQ
jgi:hypothetical protein